MSVRIGFPVLALLVASVSAAQTINVQQQPPNQQPSPPITIERAPGPVQQQPANQQPILAAVPDLMLRSVRLGCGANGFASMRIVTSREAFSIVYSCFPLTCDSETKTCRSSCADDSHCSGGTVCSEGKCVVPFPRCSTDGKRSVSPLGSDECEPYTCNGSTGTCNRDCRTSADCQGGYACDTTIRQCVTP